VISSQQTSLLKSVKKSERFLIFFIIFFYNLYRFDAVIMMREVRHFYTGNNFLNVFFLSAFFMFINNDVMWSKEKLWLQKINFMQEYD